MSKTKEKNIFHYHELEIETDPEVYNPAEDTFLLLETVHVVPHDMVLELGTGCGVIALACAQIGAKVVCTDINPCAVQLTKRNIQRNRHLLKGSIEVRHGDLFSVIQRTESFDVIIFNPPYLPTKTMEKTPGWFNVAVDGGPDGLHITKRFLKQLTHHLQPHGRAYFLFSSLCNRIMLEQYLDEQELEYDLLAGYVFDTEELNVYGVTPKH